MCTLQPDFVALVQITMVFFPHIIMQNCRECNQPQSRKQLTHIMAVTQCFFFQELKHQENQTKRYGVKEGRKKTL